MNENKRSTAEALLGALIALRDTVPVLINESADKSARIKELEDQLFGKHELWCVHLVGADQLLPMASKQAAEQHAQTLSTMMGEGQALVVPSPLPLDVHMTKLAQLLSSWLRAANAELDRAKQSLVALSDPRLLVAAESESVADDGSRTAIS